MESTERGAALRTEADAHSGAMRSAGAGSQPGSQSASPRPLGRVRVLKWWPLAALAGVIAFAAVFVLHYGLAAHEWQPDEVLTISGGRRFDQSFWQMLFSLSPLGRGPERLPALLYALPNEIFSDTATVFRASHILFGLAYVSAAIPVYALARGLGLERWQSVLPAAAAILTPWMLYGGTLLNVALAYPTVMAFAWAAWYALMRPGFRGDALFVLFGLLAAMAREGHALFVVAGGLALLVQVWRDGGGSARWSERLRAYPMRVLRAHPLIVAAAVAVAGLVAAYGTNRLLGAAYGNATESNPVTFGVILNSTWKAVSELTVGTGFLPMMIGVPWVLHELLRPRRRSSGAFALVAVGMFVSFVAMVVFYASTTGGLSDNERYLSVLAGFPMLACAAALFRREVHPLAVLVSGLLLTRAVVTQAVYPSDAAFDYFLAPARVFFSRVLQGQLSTRLPFSDTHLATTLMLLAVAAAVLVVLIARMPRRLGRWSTLIPAAVLCLVIAEGAAAGIYDGNHFETLGTFPALTFEEQSFVDTVTRQQATTIWDYMPPGAPNIAFEEESAPVFNRSITSTLHLNGTEPEANIGVGISGNVNPRTGRFWTNAPLTDYLLAPWHFTAVGFDTALVSAPSTALGAEPLVVERFVGRPRVGYSVEGAEGEGWIVSPQHAAAIRLFPSPRRFCWQTAVVAPPVLIHPIRYAITGPGIHQSGTLGTVGQSVPVQFQTPATRTAIVHVDLHGLGRIASGAYAAGGLAVFAPTTCPA